MKQKTSYTKREKIRALKAILKVYEFDPYWAGLCHIIKYTHHGLKPLPGYEEILPEQLVKRPKKCQDVWWWKSWDMKPRIDLVKKTLKQLHK
jgi:hypothetical protein